MAEAQPLCHNFTFRFRAGARELYRLHRRLRGAKAPNDSSGTPHLATVAPGSGRRPSGSFLEGNAMEGIHLLGEWYGCPADEPLLTQASALRDMCRQAVDESGLTILGDSFFQFEPQGVTGTVLLA